jgi:hypothetical protein
MEVYNGNLIVGGYFMSANGLYAPHVARWDGTQWNNMDNGTSGPVLALCVFNGELYAAGNFQYAGIKECYGIAKWTSTGWTSVGQGVAGGDNAILALKVYNGELYAGGSFIFMNDLECYNIAKYDGNIWAPVGSIKGSNCIASGGLVTDMEIYNNELYVVGQFTEVNGMSANKMAKWNGISWCGVEYGIDLKPRNLEVYQGSLIVNGDFYSISGKGYSNIARYNPNMGITQNNNNGIKAENYQLYQNYPNPFNPSTEIQFYIEKEGNVSLKIYNSIGEEMKTLIDEFKKSGKHKARFTADNLPSGVYFYKLTVNNISESKKMILLK